MILVSSSFAVAIAANKTKYSNYSSFLTLLLCWCWVVLRMLMGAVAGDVVGASGVSGA